VLQTSARPDLTDLEQLLAITALPQRRPGSVVVEVRGEIDAYTEPLLRACLRSQITRPAVTDLVVDLRAVTFL
jgi:anti-anti-sigma factor